MVWNLLGNLRDYYLYSHLFLSVIALLPIPWILGYRDAMIFPIPKKIEDLWHTLGAIIRIPLFLLIPPLFWISYAFYFWICFDGAYNLKAYKDWWRVGTTAESDKITSKYHHQIKWVGLVLSIVITLIIYLWKR
jgi:hypothetical protein